MLAAAGAAPARRRRSGKRRRLFAAGLTVVAAHVGVLLVLLSARAGSPPPAAPNELIPVMLVGPQPEAEAAPAPSSAPPTPVQPPPPRNLARRSPARPDVVPLPAGEGEAADSGVTLSDAQIAGAATAGSGAAGRPCDMVRRLQTALRKDPQIQAAVADAHHAEGSAGKALLVWNGDWIRSHGQDGAGLAAVREAIMWEVAFAPEACRAEPVHGLVLISLNDGPGSGRLVVGSGDWRWSDLLRPRPGGG